MEQGARAGVLEELADLVPTARAERSVLVGIDGVDGSGKTVLAGELAAVLAARGRPVDVVHLDDFHHLRPRRHRRGRGSPEGFFLDSYDYGALDRLLLGPLASGGGGGYTARWTDLEADRVVADTPRIAPPGLVLVLEGIFLHRDELVGRFDLSVFVDVPFAVSVARTAARDGSEPDADHPSQRRYVEGQRLYLARCDPRGRATVVLDNADLEHPRLLR